MDLADSAVVFFPPRRSNSKVGMVRGGMREVMEVRILAYHVGAGVVSSEVETSVVRR